MVWGGRRRRRVGHVAATRQSRRATCGRATPQGVERTGSRVHGCTKAIAGGARKGALVPSGALIHAHTRRPTWTTQHGHEHRTTDATRRSSTEAATARDSLSHAAGSAWHLCTPNGACQSVCTRVSAVRPPLCGCPRTPAPHPARRAATTALSNALETPCTSSGMHGCMRCHTRTHVRWGRGSMLMCVRTAAICVCGDALGRRARCSLDAARSTRRLGGWDDGAPRSPTGRSTARCQRQRRGQAPSSPSPPSHQVSLCSVTSMPNL